MSAYHKIANSIDYLVAHYTEQPDLDRIAARAGYEATHFQKLFKEYVGVSPKRLVQYMNMRHARDLLEGGRSTFDTALDTGLSGGGRLHDLFVSCEGVMPGDVKRKGEGLQIVYGYAPSPMGELMIGKTPRGICWLGFVMGEDRAEPLERLKARWPLAEFIHDDAVIKSDADVVSQIWGKGTLPSRKLKLDLMGTNFQLQVWQALLQIPIGETVTYQDVARQVCTEKASRAVGGAVGANPVSILIPCHRVIRSTGIIDNYAWGSARKR